MLFSFKSRRLARLLAVGLATLLIVGCGDSENVNPINTAGGPGPGGPPNPTLTVSPTV